MDLLDQYKKLLGSPETVDGKLKMAQRICEVKSLLENQYDKLIAEARQQCTHSKATVESYVDYDRTEYSVRCPICGKTLYNGRVWGYRRWEDSYAGDIVNGEQEVE